MEATTPWARRPYARAVFGPVSALLGGEDSPAALFFCSSCRRGFSRMAPAVYYNGRSVPRFTGAELMAITIDAVYENGVFKPLRPLQLKEQQQVRITLEEPVDWVYRTRGIIPCSDQALTEWAAMDKDLEYDFGKEP
jgi:predicted DNA-binding antitoxin AbrB/MazE fold protein